MNRAVAYKQHDVTVIKADACTFFSFLSLIETFLWLTFKLNEFVI